MKIKKPALGDIIVELHVPDFKKVKDFYGGLGFSVVWEHEPGGQKGYLVVRRQNSILSFFCGNEEVYNHSFFKKFPKDTIHGYGVEIAIYISDQNIEKYYNEVVANNGKECVVEELSAKTWGRDFRIVDPFGYYLSIREADNILEK